MPRDLTAPAKTLDQIGILLHQAADIIDHLGHTKDTLQDPTGVCIYGAVAVALAHGESAWSMSRPYFDSIDPVAHRLGFSDSEQVCRWNNAPERTKAEVVARLRAAA